jgi:hypothetical protein
MTTTQLRVFSNDTYTVVAADPNDAIAVLEATYGPGVIEELKADEFSEYPDDKVVRVTDNEGDLRKKGYTTEPNPLTGAEVVSKTAAEWIACEGRCVLSTTEF